MELDMKNRIGKLIGDDLWVVLLDVLAVNLSYYLALMLRSRIEFGYFYGEGFSTFFSAFYRFAPLYTLLCILVFFAFRLYGGLWRYAGISDMNRVIAASFVTCILHVFGSFIFIRPLGYRHMPITYHAFGAVLQFFFVLFTRFSYRIFVIERHRAGKKPATALVVGVGEFGKQTEQVLQNGTYYQVGCIIDIKNEHIGRFMDGIPVYEKGRIEEAIRRFHVTCVFLAEPELDEATRQEIKSICKQMKIELRDYSNFYKINIEMESNVSNSHGTAGNGRRIPFSPPDIGESEIAEVVETLESGWITTGPRTKLLERRLAAYIETGSTSVDTEKDVDRWKDRVVCLNSATAAEELNLRILGVKAGDEVIVPAYTYTASASAAIHCGATVKFVDIQKDGDSITHMPEMDYDALEAAITERTKAVIVVDIGGIVADYQRVFDIVERKRSLFTPLKADGSPLGNLSARIQTALGRVAVVADCAHSLGASRIIQGRRRYCGAIGDFTDFSFHAVKNFTTAEGGASTWRSLPGIDNAEIYKMFQLLSLHGQSKDALAKTQIGAWEYDVIGPWYKCNMTDIMAAIGLRQLDRYPGLLKRRDEIMQKYDATCDGLGISHLVHHTENMDSSNHLYLIRVPGIDTESRNLIIKRMAEKGVATNVHFKPLPMMTAYGKDCSAYPNAYDYYQNLITLPLHTLLSDEDVKYVCETLEQTIQKRE